MKLIRLVLRKARSAIVRLTRSVQSRVRVACVRLLNEGVTLPYSTELGRAVAIRTTDGGRLRVGPNASIGANTQITVKGTATMTIGEATFIGQGCTLVAKQCIDIGQKVLIGEYVTIRDQDHRICTNSTIMESGFVTSPVAVGAGAWIGCKATILRGSVIGAGAVIGAHSVVKGKVPANAVAVGAPARVIRKTRNGHER